MKYYHILTSGIIGDSYYASNFHPDDPFIDSSQQKVRFVLEIDADSLPYSFFSNHWNHYFVKSDFKPVLESYGFNELSFEPIDHLIIGLNLQDQLGHNFNESSFWKVKIESDEKNFEHFCLWDNRYLVVSEKALKVLSDHGSFDEQIEGRAYGPEFEVLTNKFLIDAPLDDFFKNRWPIIWNTVEYKRKMIHAEYRKRQGLPPLQ